MKLDPKTTAILTLDFQAGILGLVQDSSKCLVNASKVVKAARKNGFKVMHVGLGFSPGYPEVSQTNHRFSQLRSSGRLVRGTESARFHPEIFEDGETVITKYRVSGFAGSNLQMILRAQGAQTLVLFGVSTSGVLLSTVREAADLDYHLIVVADASFDRDDEVHRILTQKVFPTQATVISTEEFVSKYV